MKGTGQMSHRIAIEVLKGELEAVQANCVYLAGGLKSMLKRNLTPGHSIIREAALMRWRHKLEEQVKRSESLIKSIKFLEEQEQ